MQVPVSVSQILDLKNVVSDPSLISFGTTSIISEHRLCCQTMVDGDRYIAILDPQKSAQDEITKFKMTAEAVALHPSRLVLALRGGQFVQIVDLEHSSSLKKSKFDASVDFFKWIDEQTLAVVTKTNVYHLGLGESEEPILIFQRSGDLSDCTITNYQADSYRQFCLLHGTSIDPQTRTLKGNTQVYSIAREKSQFIPANYAVLIDAESDFKWKQSSTPGNQTIEKEKLTLLCFAVGGKLRIQQLHPEASSPENLIRNISDLHVGDEKDVVVTMSYVASLGFVFVLTAQGLLTVTEVQSGLRMNETAIRVSNNMIFSSAPDQSPLIVGQQEQSSLLGCVAVDSTGLVLHIAIERNSLLQPLIKGSSVVASQAASSAASQASASSSSPAEQQQQQQNAAAAAMLSAMTTIVKIVLRSGLNGSGRLIQETFESALRLRDYKTAALIAANSPDDSELRVIGSEGKGSTSPALTRFRKSEKEIESELLEQERKKASSVGANDGIKKKKSKKNKEQGKKKKGKKLSKKKGKSKKRSKDDEDDSDEEEEEEEDDDDEEDEEDEDENSHVKTLQLKQQQATEGKSFSPLLTASTSPLQIYLRALLDTLKFYEPEAQFFAPIAISDIQSVSGEQSARQPTLSTIEAQKVIALSLRSHKASGNHENAIAILIRLGNIIQAVNYGVEQVRLRISQSLGSEQSTGDENKNIDWKQQVIDQTTANGERAVQLALLLANTPIENVEEEDEKEEEEENKEEEKEEDDEEEEEADDDDTENVKKQKAKKKALKEKEKKRKEKEKEKKKKEREKEKEERKKKANDLPSLLKRALPPGCTALLPASESLDVFISLELHREATSFMMGLMEQETQGFQLTSSLKKKSAQSTTPEHDAAQKEKMSALQTKYFTGLVAARPDIAAQILQRGIFTTFDQAAVAQAAETAQLYDVAVALYQTPADVARSVKLYAVAGASQANHAAEEAGSDGQKAQATEQANQAKAAVDKLGNMIITTNRRLLTRGLHTEGAGAAQTISFCISELIANAEQLSRPRINGIQFVGAIAKRILDNATVAVSASADDESQVKSAQIQVAVSLVQVLEKAHDRALSEANKSTGGKSGSHDRESQEANQIDELLIALLRGVGDTRGCDGRCLRALVSASIRLRKFDLATRAIKHAGPVLKKATQEDEQQISGQGDVATVQSLLHFLEEHSPDVGPIVALARVYGLYSDLARVMFLRADSQALVRFVIDCAIEGITGIRGITAFAPKRSDDEEEEEEDGDEEDDIEDIKDNDEAEQARKNSLISGPTPEIACALLNNEASPDDVLSFLSSVNNAADVCNATNVVANIYNKAIQKSSDNKKGNEESQTRGRKETKGKGKEKGKNKNKGKARIDPSKLIIDKIAMCPAGALARGFVERGKLSVLRPWLEERVSNASGRIERDTHTALALVYVEECAKYGRDAGFSAPEAAANYASSRSEDSDGQQIAENNQQGQKDQSQQYKQFTFTSPFFQSISEEDAFASFIGLRSSGAGSDGIGNRSFSPSSSPATSSYSAVRTPVNQPTIAESFLLYTNRNNSSAQTILTRLFDFAGVGERCKMLGLTRLALAVFRCGWSDTQFIETAKTGLQGVSKDDGDSFHRILAEYASERKNLPVWRTIISDDNEWDESIVSPTAAVSATIAAAAAAALVMGKSSSSQWGENQGEINNDNKEEKDQQIQELKTHSSMNIIDMRRRDAVVDVALTQVLPRLTDKEQLAQAVKGFLCAGFAAKVVPVLQEILLPSDESRDAQKQGKGKQSDTITALRTDNTLQNLLLIGAISARVTQLSKLVTQLNNYDSRDIAQRATAAKLPEIALAVYAHAGMHVDAVRVLVEGIGDLNRAEALAAETGERECWAAVAQALLEKELVERAVDAYIRIRDASEHHRIVELCHNKGLHAVLARFLRMARYLRLPELDTELLCTLARAGELAELEETVAAAAQQLKADLGKAGETCFTEGLYAAARILFSAAKSYARLASTLVKLGEYSAAVEAARNAQAIPTWREVCHACVKAGETRLAQICGVPLALTGGRELQAIITFYRQHGLFAEIVALLESAIQQLQSGGASILGLPVLRGKEGKEAERETDRATQLQTQLVILFAQHFPERALGYIKANHLHLQSAPVLRVLGDNELWVEARTLQLLRGAEGADGAVSIILTHPEFAWDHAVLKEAVKQASNIELIYKALDVYAAQHPLQLVDFISAPGIASRVDCVRVITQAKRGSWLQLIKKYLQDIQSGVVSPGTAASTGSPDSNENILAQSASASGKNLLSGTEGKAKRSAAASLQIVRSLLNPVVASHPCQAHIGGLESSTNQQQTNTQTELPPLCPIGKVNEALHELYLADFDAASLELSVCTQSSYDQEALARQLEHNSLLRLRRISAALFAANGKFSHAVTIFRVAGLHGDAIRCVSLSGDTSLAEALLRFFAHEVKIIKQTQGDAKTGSATEAQKDQTLGKSAFSSFSASSFLSQAQGQQLLPIFNIGLSETERAACFTALLFECYELLPPNAVIETAWETGLTDYAIPFIVQQTKEWGDERKDLNRRLQTLEGSVSALAHVVFHSGANQTQQQTKQQNVKQSEKSKKESKSQTKEEEDEEEDEEDEEEEESRKSKSKNKTKKSESKTSRKTQSK